MFIHLVYPAFVHSRLVLFISLKMKPIYPYMSKYRYVRNQTRLMNDLQDSYHLQQHRQLLFYRYQHRNLYHFYKPRHHMHQIR